MKKYLLPIILFLAFFLRFYKLDQVPPSLYWDEASLGYNAFAISETLHDEHGVFLPVSNFAAFGDYKPPAYIYAIVPFIKLFGLNEVSVRLPSVLAGTLLVLVSYYLVLELFKKERLGLVTALFVAISPWSLQMSRAAFEANLATLLSGLGILFFLRAVHSQKNKFYLLAALFFVLSMYTFNSHRIFSPLVAAGLSVIYLKDILKNFRKSFVFYLLAVILLLPLIPHLLSPEGSLRFNEVSWLKDLDIVKASNERIAQNNNALWAKIVYNRRIFYAVEFAGHYLDHFKPDFLFAHGDINPRLSVRDFGEMYWFDLPLLIFGLIYLLRHKSQASVVLLVWLLVAPIPAAFAKQTPHALRILNILPVPQIISALGFIWIAGKWRWLKYLVCTVIVISFYLYLQSYYFEYPKKYAADWQYGYKQMVTYVKTIENNYDHIFVTNHYGRPYIYLLFYDQYDPRKYWANRDAGRDRFGFWEVRSFDKYVFFQPDRKTGRWLYILSPEEKGSKLIKDLGEFQIYE